jgi:hypothetical protein
MAAGKQRCKFLFEIVFTVSSADEIKHCQTIFAVGKTLFTELGLCGAYITVDGIVVAAALGEIVGNVLFEHVEKALVEYTGIYPMMASSFASLFGKNVRYINREEDEGDEGLRRSKMSYHPVILKEKYIAK